MSQTFYISLQFSRNTLLMAIKYFIIYNSLFKRNPYLLTIYIVSKYLLLYITWHLSSEHSCM